MNDEEALAKVEKLIVEYFKTSMTAACHLSDYNIDWMGKKIHSEVQEYNELRDYLKEALSRNSDCPICGESLGYICQHCGVFSCGNHTYFVGDNNDQVCHVCWVKDRKK